MKIGLGTVQFGLDYGISNAAGRVPVEEVRAILARAAAAGLRVLDTAAAYGASESVLGETLPATHGFDVVTKLPRLPSGLSDAEVTDWVRTRFAESLQRLRCAAVHGLLMHSGQDLLSPQGQALFTAMRALQAEGRVRLVGASVYDGAEIDALLERYDLDLVQLPINLLDHRLIEGGQLRRLRQRGVEIHARSLLLQGLLVMPPEQLGPHFAPALPALRRLRELARSRGLTPLALAVAFVNAVPEIDCAVFGVTSAEQLQEILDAASLPSQPDWYAGCRVNDESILNPARWPRT